MSRFPVLRFLYHLLPGKALRQSAYHAFLRLGPRMRDVTIEGVHFRLDMSEVIDSALFVGRWEPDVVEAIKTHCRPNMVVLDIGANVGAHTFRFAQAVGRAGVVHAIEPTVFAFNKLEANLSRNDLPQVRLHRIALWDTDQNSQLINWKSSWQTNGGMHPDCGPCTVDFRRLDGWCTEMALDRIDLIKIDIDGNEFPVLDGGREVLSKHHPIMLMEAVSPHFTQPDKNPFLLLEKLGYRFEVPARKQSGLSASDLRAMLPDNDPGMTVSLNVVARVSS